MGISLAKGPSRSIKVQVALNSLPKGKEYRLLKFERSLKKEIKIKKDFSVSGAVCWWPSFREGRDGLSQIPSCFLFFFNGLKQGFKISFAKTFCTFTLNDLEE